jgi:DNA uptake protein ComE-like DNA-binding protein
MDRFPEVFEKIRPLVFISSEVQRPIDINVAEWVELVRHPYIEKPIANSIIAIREQHGPYKSIEDIKRSHLINDDLYKKLEPYLIVSQ